MTCPDWERLLAHRFRSGVEPPPDWKAARSHLDACDACRAVAARVDPTVAFHGAARWQPAAAETTAILQAVRTLRRAGDFATAPEPSPRRTPRHRAAAAAVFAVLLALLPGSTARRGASPADPSRLSVMPRRMQLAPPAAPALDGLDRPRARVYEWGGVDQWGVMVGGL
jgi:hypothetical protein